MASSATAQTMELAQVHTIVSISLRPVSDPIPADGQTRLPDRPRETIPEEMGRREGLPRRRPHPRAARWTVSRTNQGEISQVVRELPVPIHEWLPSLGTRVHDLQDRVWSGLPEVAGQESIVPPRIPLYWYANQGPRSSTAQRMFCNSLYASCSCEYRPRRTRSSVKWRCSERTLKASAKKKTNRQLPLPQRVPLWARPQKENCKPSQLATPTSSRSWNPSKYHDRRSRSSPIHIIGWSTSHQLLS